MGRRVSGLLLVWGGVEFRAELEQAGQQAVDERRRPVRRQVAGEEHRLADRDPVGHSGAPVELVQPDPQDVPVHGGHPVQRPALRVLAQQLIDALTVRLDAADQFCGVTGDRRAAPGGRAAPRRGSGGPLRGQVEHGLAPDLGLEEEVERALPGLTACWHGRPGLAGGTWGARSSSPRRSTLACSPRTPALKGRSTTLPDSTFFSLVRTNAPPLPGLTCWKSTTFQSWPSMLRVMPFLRSLVVATDRVSCVRAEPARPGYRTRSSLVVVVSISGDPAGPAPARTTTVSSILTPPLPGR